MVIQSDKLSAELKGNQTEGGTMTTTKSKWYEIGFKDGEECGRECQSQDCYSYDLAGLEPWDAWLLNGAGFAKVEELLECGRETSEWDERLADYAAGAMAGYTSVG